MGERNLRNRQLEPLRSRIGAAFAKSVTKREVGTVADRVAILAIPAESANGATEAPLLQEELERAQRVAGGQIGAQDLDWLSKGFSAFLANGGALPLERCLRLPGRDGALRRECRDYWLRSAWKMTGGDPSPWCRSEMLAVEVRNFAARQWVRWCTLQSVPPEASELETALFHAFRAYERIPVTAMQLHNIAHHRRHS
jgi:hypothetical protein